MKQSATVNYMKEDLKKQNTFETRSPKLKLNQKTNSRNSINTPLLQKSSFKKEQLTKRSSFGII